MLTKRPPVSHKCLIKDLGESDACRELFGDLPKCRNGYSGACIDANGETWPGDEPSSAAPEPTWPTGAACNGHVACIGFDKRRRALEDAETAGVIK